MSELLLAAGSDEQAASELKAVTQDDDIYIHEVLMDAVNLFMSMQTQWRTGMSGATGLDYSVMRFVAQSIGVKVTKEVFWQVGVMERRALGHLNKH